MCSCAQAWSFQSCLTHCDPMDCSPPGFTVYGILQARILEWVATPSPGDLPDPGIEPVSLTSPVLAGGFCITTATWKAHLLYTRHYIWCLIIKYLHNISQKSVSYLHFQNKQRGYLSKVTHEKQQTSVWF